MLLARYLTTPCPRLLSFVDVLIFLWIAPLDTPHILAFQSRQERIHRFIPVGEIDAVPFASLGIDNIVEGLCEVNRAILVELTIAEQNTESIFR